MGLRRAPGGSYVFPLAHLDAGGIQGGFQTTFRIPYDPVGVGCLGEPTAMPYVLTTSPYFRTVSDLAPRLASRVNGDASGVSLRDAAPSPNMSAAAIGIENSAMMERERLCI